MARGLTGPAAGRRVVTVVDVHSTGVSVGGEAPVLGGVLASEVELEMEGPLFAGLHLDARETLGATLESKVGAIAVGADGIRALDSRASLWDAALVPGVGSDVDGLVNVGLDSHVVTSAASAAPGHGAVAGRLVVKHEEVVVAPAISVEVASREVELSVEVSDVHPEDAVFLVQGVANLSEESGSPAGISITPGAVVVLFTVRVSDLDEVVASGGLLDSEHSESVTLNEASRRLGFVRARWGAS